MINYFGHEISVPDIFSHQKIALELKKKTSAAGYKRFLSFCKNYLIFLVP
jgi:hypothetical protein